MAGVPLPNVKDGNPQRITYFEVEGTDPRTPEPEIVVTRIGTIMIKPNQHFSIEISVDKAIRVTDSKNFINVTILGYGSISGLSHPTGQFSQVGSNYLNAICCSDYWDSKRYAVLTKNGARFKSEKSNIVYYFDSNGVRSNPGCISIPKGDMTMVMFLHHSLHGREYIKSCIRLLRAGGSFTVHSEYKRWIVGQISVTAFKDGPLSVRQLNSDISIEMDPAYGSVDVRTPLVRMISSMDHRSQTHLLYEQCHLFANKKKFIISFAGNSAGFDCDKEVHT